MAGSPGNAERSDSFDAPTSASARAPESLASFDRPTPARMYDYYLDGKDNFEVDRAAVDALYTAIGDLPKLAAWENRKFLWRAVEYLAGEAGISQFLDVGAGLPTARSTHEVAQQANPDARVVYADNDPIVLSHGRALLTKDGNVTVVTADARDPASILDSPETTALIDFSRPVAVMFVALLHFLTDPGHPRHEPGSLTPAEIVAAFGERVAPGSYLVLSHLTTHEAPPEPIKAVEDVYEQATSPVVFRSRDGIAALFDGWDLIPPGLVRPWEWRAGPNESPRTPYFLAGVAHKPS